jgi:hypothetical protein
MDTAEVMGKRHARRPSRPRSSASSPDTHGLIRDSLVEALAGPSQRILHAGDVGGRSVLDALSTIFRAGSRRCTATSDPRSTGVAAAAESTRIVVVSRSKSATEHEARSSDPPEPADAFTTADVLIYGPHAQGRWLFSRRRPAWSIQSRRGGAPALRDLNPSNARSCALPNGNRRTSEIVAGSDPRWLAVVQN